jgi:hypothetical protein
MIGVVILGFVIGAGLSVAGKHGSQSVALATSTPEAEPTIAPVTAAPPRPAASTPAALASVRPTPAAASPRPSRAAAVHVPTPAASATATAAASAQPSHVQTATHVLPTANTRVLPSAAVAAETAEPPPETAQPAVATADVETPFPTARVTPEPTPVPAPTAAPVVADSAFARLAGSVVRQYLISIANGDRESAYAALGLSPGSQAGALPEAGVLDSSMHIGKIEAHGSESAATVDVELSTANGPYSGQYTVHKSATGAAIIVSHSFGKP